MTAQFSAPSVDKLAVLGRFDLVDTVQLRATPRDRCVEAPLAYEVIIGTGREL